MHAFSIGFSLTEHAFNYTVKSNYNSIQELKNSAQARMHAASKCSNILYPTVLCGMLTTDSVQINNEFIGKVKMSSTRMQPCFKKYMLAWAKGTTIVAVPRGSKRYEERKGIDQFSLLLPLTTNLDTSANTSLSLAYYCSGATCVVERVVKVVKCLLNVQFPERRNNEVARQTGFLRVFIFPQGIAEGV